MTKKRNKKKRAYAKANAAHANASASNAKAGARNTTKAVKPTASVSVSEKDNKSPMLQVETLEQMKHEEMKQELNMVSVERPGEAEAIAKKQQEKKEQQAETKLTKNPRTWFRYLTGGAKIAVIAVAVLVVLVLGFFMYEFSRLQRSDPNAYSDEAVIASVKKDETDASLRLSEEAMEKQTEDLEESEAVKADGEIFRDDSVFNILLIGTDDRTENFSAEARGDSCILLSLNKATGKVSLISFERGLGVPILWGPYEGEWDWLTHSFRYGGADMMTEEIRDNFKVDVERYIRINIKTLVKLIDVIGGIDIEVTEAEANHINNPNGAFTGDYAKGVGVQDQVQELHAGINHMNGATAMVFARLRYIDDDWHRVVRQRNVIAAAAKQLNSLNVADMIKTLDALVPLVQTNLTTTEIASLMTLAPGFMGADIDQMTVPVKGTFGSMRGFGGRSMFAVDFDKNADLIRQQLYGIEAAEEGEEEDEETSKYGNPYDSNARSVNRGVTSTGSSYSRGGQSTSGAGVDNSIGEMVETAPVDTTETTVINEDGSTTTVRADGTATTTAVDGSVTTIGTDGSVTVFGADGTVTRQNADGSSVSIAADGSVTTTEAPQAKDGTGAVPGSATTPETGVTPVTGVTPAAGTTPAVGTTPAPGTAMQPGTEQGGAAGGAAAQEAAAAAGQAQAGAADAEAAAQYQRQLEEQLAAQQAAAVAAQQYAEQLAAQQQAAAGGQ